MSPTHANRHRFNHFRRGSRMDFKQYYDQYCLRIHYYLCELTGDFNAAQEITARVFVTLFTDRMKVGSERNILPLLNSVARDLANDYLRAHGRIEEVKDVSSAKTRVEILNDIHTSSPALPSKKQEVSRFYYWYNISVGEIVGIGKMESIRQF